MSDYTSITIGQVQVHVEVDSQGYLSLHTDGYPVDSTTGETLNAIMAALRSLQSDEERELDCLPRRGLRSR